MSNQCGNCHNGAFTPNGGFSGALGSNVSTSVAMAMASFTGIASYNAVELIYLILSTFKTYHSLYFWSLLSSSFGVPVYAIAFMFKYFDVAGNDIVTMVFVVIAWCFMVTGQSVVLYSRLSLVCHSLTKRRAVLAMIIFDAIICHIPIAVLSIGANSGSGAASRFERPYSLYTNVHISIFFAQETIISSLYIWETYKLLKQSSGIMNPDGDTPRGDHRKMLKHLVLMNIVIILLDLSYLLIQFMGKFAIHTVYKAMVYSIKLKMEFRILNQLIAITTTNRTSSAHSGATTIASSRHPSYPLAEKREGAFAADGLHYRSVAIKAQARDEPQLGFPKDEIFVLHETSIRFGSSSVSESEAVTPFDTNSQSQLQLTQESDEPTRDSRQV